MDDQEISDGPLKSDNDVSVYQQTFVTDHQNVKAIKDEANIQEQDKLDKEGVDVESEMSQ